MYALDPTETSINRKTATIAPGVIQCHFRLCRFGPKKYITANARSAATGAWSQRVKLHAVAAKTLDVGAAITCCSKIKITTEAISKRPTPHVSPIATA